LKLVAKSEATQFEFGYDLKVGKFASSGADDYTDYRFYGVGQFVMSQSAALRFTADSTKSHDPRGSTDRGVSGSPDEYTVNGASGLFAYGANDALGRIEVEGGVLNRKYDNNRATTAANDRDATNAAGRFFFKIAPKTSALVEFRRDKIDYTLGTSTQDSKESRLLVGLTWDATAATSGTVKVGSIKKDFDSSARKDYSGLGWETSIAWKPLSYSKVDFFANRTFNESTGVGDFLLSKRIGAIWTHGWNSNFTSLVSLSQTTDDFSGNPRSDKTNSFGLALKYKLARWATVGGDYTNTKRDSNTSGLDYSKNLYMLMLGLTL